LASATPCREFIELQLSGDDKLFGPSSVAIIVQK